MDVYALRRGKGRSEGPRYHIVRPRGLARWWLDRLLAREAWRRLPGFGRRDRPPAWMDALGWRLWQRDFYRAVARGFSERPPDLIYARNAWFAWPYLALKRRFSVPLFLEVNAVVSIERDSYGEIAFAARSRRIERELMQQADRVLPVSQQLADQIASLGVDTAHVEVTPNAVDPELFAPAPERPHDPSRFVVGAASSMRPYHGTATLLRAAALLRPQLPGLRLLLVGEGPQFAEMQALARELAIDDITEFTGVLDHEEVARRLRDCDVCVSPNEGEFNRYNCPMKLFEYMSMKVPVVASRWGEISAIVRDGETGLLHEPGDPASLAEALRAVAQDPYAARRRAERAWQEMQPHTWRAIARRVIAWAGVPHTAPGPDSLR